MLRYNQIHAYWLNNIYKASTLTKPTSGSLIFLLSLAFTLVFIIHSSIEKTIHVYYIFEFKRKKKGITLH